MARHWQIIDHDARDFDAGNGAKAAIGFISLSVDRASEMDCRRWMSGVEGAALFSTRVPMQSVATPETLAEMGAHISAAAAVLVPESALDAVIFSCTSGAVAIGPQPLRDAIAKARGPVPVVTPIEAAQLGFRGLGVERLSILAPYHLRACDLVAGSFEAAGFALQNCATFDLDGDLEMNRLSAAALLRAAHAALHPQSEALFISCTGLRTKGVVAQLEAELGLPVITSNQASVWQALNHAGVRDFAGAEGRLFSVLAAEGGRL